MEKITTHPKPYSKEEEEYLDYLVEKYCYKLGTRKEKYRIYKYNKDKQDIK